MREQENTLQADFGKAGAALSNRKLIPLQRAATFDPARCLCKWHRGTFAPQQGAIEPFFFPYSKRRNTFESEDVQRVEFLHS